MVHVFRKAMMNVWRCNGCLLTYTRSNLSLADWRWIMLSSVLWFTWVSFSLWRPSSLPISDANPCRLSTITSTSLKERENSNSYYNTTSHNCRSVISGPHTEGVLLRPSFYMQRGFWSVLLRPSFYMQKRFSEALFYMQRGILFCWEPLS